MECPRCNAEVQEQSRFCSVCHKDLTPQYVGAVRTALTGEAVAVPHQGTALPTLPEPITGSFAGTPPIKINTANRAFQAILNHPAPPSVSPVAHRGWDRRWLLVIVSGLCFLISFGLFLGPGGIYQTPWNPYIHGFFSYYRILTYLFYALLLTTAAAMPCWRDFRNRFNPILHSIVLMGGLFCLIVMVAQAFQMGLSVDPNAPLKPQKQNEQQIRLNGDQGLMMMPLMEYLGLTGYGTWWMLVRRRQLQAEEEEENVTHIS